MTYVALISGQQGIAAILQGESVVLYKADDPQAKSATLPKTILRTVFSNATDIIRYTASNLDHILQKLRNEWAQNRGVHLIGILLDQEEEKSVRSLSAEVLNRLAEEDAFKFVLNRLYSISISKSPPALDNSLILSENLSQAIETFIASQPSINSLLSSWKTVEKKFQPTPSLSEIYYKLISEGWIRQFAEALTKNQSIGMIRMKCLSAFNNKPAGRQIIEEWLRPIVRMSNRGNEIPQKFKEHNEYKSFSDLPISSKKEKVDAFAAFSNVEKQKKGIISAIKNGDLKSAREYTKDLVNAQIRTTNDPTFAAKSLCSIAQKTKKLGLTSFQIELCKMAVDIAEGDAWANGQLADAYLSNGNLDLATQYFQIAEKLGGGSFGKAGKARLLRSQGLYLDAILEFDQLMNQYPHDIDLVIGKGEVLREMGKSQEALALLGSAKERFPSACQIHCTYAAILKDIGNLGDAKQAYQLTKKFFPDDEVPYCGFADILKELGEFDSAIREYEYAVTKFSESPVPLCGLADVYREACMLDKALRTYEDAAEKFPHEMVPISGKAEVLKEMGREHEAIGLLKTAVSKYPDEPRFLNSWAATLRRKGDLREALRRYDESVQKFPYDNYALSGRASALKALGKFQESAEAFEQLHLRDPENLSYISGLAASYVAQSRHEDALKILPDSTPKTKYEWICFHIKSMIYLKTGRFDEAVDCLTHGINSNPFARQRKFFEQALVTAKLRQGKLNDIEKLLGNEKDLFSNVLRIHAHAALTDLDAARRVYSTTEAFGPPLVVQLRALVAIKYGIRKGIKGRHGDDTIFSQECRIILSDLAA